MTYELKEDALDAIKQFDGANANGTYRAYNSGGRNKRLTIL